MKIRSLLSVFLLLSVNCSPSKCYAKPAEIQEIPVVSINGEIDEDLSLGFQAALEALAAKNPKAIIVEINSPGGGVAAGFQMAKEMENLKVPVICVVDAKAVSMGYYLLQSCDVRLMTKRAVLMIHEPLIVGFSGSPSDFANIANFLHKTSEAMVEHNAKRMRITPDEMMARIQNGGQWWMSWKDGWEWGAVDGVVESTQAVREALAADKVPENLAKDLEQVKFP